VWFSVLRGKTFEAFCYLCQLEPLLLNEKFGFAFSSEDA